MQDINCSLFVLCRLPYIITRPRATSTLYSSRLVILCLQGVHALHVPIAEVVELLDAVVNVRLVFHNVVPCPAASPEGRHP